VGPHVIDAKSLSGRPAGEFKGVVWERYGDPGDGSGCVEIAELGDGFKAMRDSSDPEGPALVFTPGEWDAFVLGVKAGEFDLPPELYDEATDAPATAPTADVEH
jgi:hypothetical protein